MKQIIFSGLLSALSFCAIAHSGSKQPLLARHRITNMLEATNFDLEGNRLVFSKLPANASSLTINGENGNVELSSAISRRNNSINIVSLPSGCHTITLRQGDAIKTFGYFSGTVVVAHKTFH